MGIVKDVRGCQEMSRMTGMTVKKDVSGASGVSMISVLCRSLMCVVSLMTAMSLKSKSILAPFGLLNLVSPIRLISVWDVSA